MAEISEAIAMIKKAEDEADQLILDSEFKSKEMIDESKVNADNTIMAAKDEASKEAEKTVFDAEDKAKSEAKSIVSDAEGNLSSLKSKAMQNVDDAASIIVKNIL